jgi:type I restriction enzyme S subunit
LLVVEGNGSLAHIGRVALWNLSIPDARHQNHIICIRPKGVSPEFLLNWLASPDGRERIVDAATSAAGLYTLSLSKVSALDVPVPPPAEQQRIVAKLEDLLARSRRAKDALDAIPPLLEKLRQSILAAAFRGDLTAEWRKKNPDVEPADKLLARIRIERRKKWEEAELAKMKAKGKTPTDDRWKEKYQEPEPVDASELPELPEGWCWAAVDGLTSDIVDCLHRTPPYVEDGIPAIRTADVVSGRLLLNQARRVTRETYLEQIVRLTPEVGDVLYTREGERFGLAALVPPGVELCMSQRMMQLRLVPGISPSFFMWALNSPDGYGQAVEAVGGSTSPHVNIGDIRRFHLPVAPQSEQVAIGHSINKALGAVDALRSIAIGAIPRVLQFEAASLSKAFRGDLLPQDPDEEPAEAVLDQLDQPTIENSAELS